MSKQPLMTSYLNQLVSVKEAQDANEIGFENGMRNAVRIVEILMGMQTGDIPDSVRPMFINIITKLKEGTNDEDKKLTEQEHPGEKTWSAEDLRDPE